jgi:hypothetical protein
MRRRDMAYHHIRSLPTIFMDDEKNAEYHLKRLCPGCKVKESRYLPEIGDCPWKFMWEMGLYDILPRSISLGDAASLLVKGSIDMEKYRRLLKTWVVSRF